jgi:hypothetical protein
MAVARDVCVDIDAMRTAAWSAGALARRSTEVQVARLLGLPVADGHGRRIGRTREIQAEREGPDWVARGYVIRVGGLIDRPAAGGIAQAPLGCSRLGAGTGRSPGTSSTSPIPPG